MTNKYFTEKEVNELNINPNVKAVSNKAITYTEEFKRLFISESKKGKLPRAIFEENGFNIDVIGPDRVKKVANR
ncbi:hypothetical protein SAMN05877753_10125 [Bacillus oleivorans]|uniref:Uncharacterized protein n=1 Tax=Bacillus oleivorans TaxID=1448271 RepID=A0A285CGJ4_9BACI|nr:hypothetical protein SAMN05877753_10125 [Bacillus oleivorans]